MTSSESLTISLVPEVGVSQRVKLENLHLVCGIGYRALWTWHRHLNRVGAQARRATISVPRRASSFQPRAGCGINKLLGPFVTLALHVVCPWSVTSLMLYKLSHAKSSRTCPRTYCPNMFFFFFWLKYKANVKFRNSKTRHLT